MRYKIRFLPYNTDAWITIRHFLYLLFICTTYFSMIVHVPKVSHNTFRICTPYIVHTTYHHNIVVWYQLLYLLISWPLVSHQLYICISKTSRNESSKRCSKTSRNCKKKMRNCKKKMSIQTWMVFFGHKN